MPKRTCCGVETTTRVSPERKRDDLAEAYAAFEVHRCEDFPLREEVNQAAAGIVREATESSALGSPISR
jgi:hypothetical protein